MLARHEGSVREPVMRRLAEHAPVRGEVRLETLRGLGEQLEAHVRFAWKSEKCFR